MSYLPVAAKLLRGHELGGNEHLAGVLLCDKCGKPWKECSGARERWLRVVWPDRINHAHDPALNFEGWQKEDNICPGGNPTVGVGLNFYARELCAEAIEAQQIHDLGEAERQVREWLGMKNRPPNYSWKPICRFDLLSDNRKAALLDLAHWGNIQSGKMLRKSLLSAIGSSPTPQLTFFEDAAREILWKDGYDEIQGRSGWYEISPTRATELAEIIETDELPTWAKGE